MSKRWRIGSIPLLISLCLPVAAQDHAQAIRVNWDTVIAVSKTTPTLQVVVNPKLLAGSNLHDAAFEALHGLGADYVRFVPWFPYPRLVVAELKPPADGRTFWNFSPIDPVVDDFMKATAGHSVVMNFSTIPAWMFRTSKPVTYPEDPNQVDWDYTQGTELRDPSMKEVSAYYARLIGWYTQGGFRDEIGQWHASGHHYKIAYWEVLNEVDAEHRWTPESYTKFYDAVTAAMRKVDPELKFVALALADPGGHPEMFEYFLNPAHHAGGTPLDFISYHFYATPRRGEGPETWQYTFFDQEAGFLNTVRYVEAIRKRLSPSTKTDLDELGVILPTDNQPGDDKPIASAYWNLAGALYADLYVHLARMGIEVAGESQLVGYPTQYPSVSMMDYVTAKPNARFRVLQLLKDHFSPGDRLVETGDAGDDLTVQAFENARGKCILAINKRLKGEAFRLPAGFRGTRIDYVAPSTGEQPPMTKAVAGDTILLEPNEVAIISE
ncbi:MAG TPA: glycosyl hydrolase family 39 [Acidobacteriaceae bacterium]|nr:glycosyl hydrolase family 39 [Acidobacteriaceae bacterium]